MRLDCFLADSCECAPPTDSLPMPYADLVLGWPMQRSLRRRLCDNGVRQQLADFGYCHGHVLKAVRAVDLCQTLVECTEREMTGLAGYL
jgi:hypothetical protein